MQAQFEDGGCEWAGLTHLQASHTFLLLQQPQSAYWLVIYTVLSVSLTVAEVYALLICELRW